MKVVFLIMMALLLPSGTSLASHDERLSLLGEDGSRVENRQSGLRYRGPFGSRNVKNVPTEIVLETEPSHHSSYENKTSQWTHMSGASLSLNDEKDRDFEEEEALFSSLGEAWDSFKTQDYDTCFKQLFVKETDPKAMYLLGKIFEKGDGKGLYPSFERAAEWYTRAIRSLNERAKERNWDEDKNPVLFKKSEDALIGIIHTLAECP